MEPEFPGICSLLRQKSPLYTIWKLIGHTIGNHVFCWEGRAPC